MPAVLVSANPHAHLEHHFAQKGPGAEAYHRIYNDEDHYNGNGVQGGHSQPPLHSPHDPYDHAADQPPFANSKAPAGSLDTMKPSSPLTRFQVAFPESSSPRMPANASNDRWEGSSNYRAEEQQSPQDGSQLDALRLQTRPFASGSRMNAADGSPTPSQLHSQSRASYSQSHLDKFSPSPRRPLAFGEQVAAKASWSRKASDLPTVTVPMGRVERNFSSAISSHRGHFPASSKYFLTVVPPEE